MASCASCGAALETPLVCSACGALFAPDPAPSPFEVFGLETAFAVDGAALEKRLLALTRRMHPDYFARDPRQHAQAEHNTAALNAAYDVVSDAVQRADWLVRHLGGPDELSERELPREFLVEVLEWNEALEAARDGGAVSGLAALERDLTQRRAASLRAIEALLTPLPAQGAAALREARALLNAVRYIDRTLEELAALRSAEPAG
jgi:molecular chaperone HscB